MHLQAHCRQRPNHQCISSQSMLAFVQSYSQSQARLMFVTTLGMDNCDCTKMNAHLEASITIALHLHPYLAKQLTALFHTQTLFSFLLSTVS